MNQGFTSLSELYREAKGSSDGSDSGELLWLLNLLFPMKNIMWKDLGSTEWVGTDLKTSISKGWFVFTGKILVENQSKGSQLEIFIMLWNICRVQAHLIFKFIGHWWLWSSYNDSYENNPYHWIFYNYMMIDACTEAVVLHPCWRLWPCHMIYKSSSYISLCSYRNYSSVWPLSFCKGQRWTRRKWSWAKLVSLIGGFCCD